MKRSAIIFDIDGTLADCEHRRHHVTGKKKDWDAFYSEMEKDPCKENVIHLLLRFATSNKFKRTPILLVTGRPERYREITYDWIVDKIGYFFRDIYMRPDGDSTPDDELKKKIYMEQIEPLYDVKLVLDDRDKVVKMWRSLGLECWQVAEGNF